MRIIPLLLALAFPVSVPAAGVTLVSVEPAGTPVNPDGRLWVRGHPARFWVRVENGADKPWSGYLEGEIAGDLETISALPRERVTLAAHEKRPLSVAWEYPEGAVFTLWNGMTRALPGPSWGQEIRVRLRDEAGQTVGAAATVFAIDHDGLPAPAKPLAATRPLGDAREAFLLRYSGYLRNPAYTPAPAGSVTFTGAVFPPEAVSAGAAPSGLIAYRVVLPAGGAPAQLTVAFSTPGQHLRRAYLLESDATPAPRATRLCHLSAGSTSTFTLPACPTAATLVLETEAVHPYQAPVPLAERAAAGEATYGPVQFPLVGSPTASSAAAWAERRKQLRGKLLAELGLPPGGTGVSPVSGRAELFSEQCVPATARLGGVVHAYTRRKLALEIAPGQRMNVWLLLPPGPGPFPAVIALHQTVAEGKDEPVGLGGHYWVLDYGPYLVDRGFVVIAPDNVRVGERYDPDTQTPYGVSDRADRDPAWSTLAQNLADQKRCLDYLDTLPQVRHGHYGCIGHSLGGQSATVLAALDDRIGAAVESCGFTLLRTYEDAAAVYGAPSGAIVSGQMRAALQLPVPQRKLPWDFSDLMALWAPTPVFMHDVKTELWPNAAQVAQAAVQVQALYQSLGAADRFRVVYSNQTHSFPAWVQPDALDWLEYWLKR